MGLYPDLLPGYAPRAPAATFHQEWGDEIPAQPGLGLPQMLDAAAAGKLQALCVVGSNPVARYNGRSVRAAQRLSSWCRTCS